MSTIAELRARLAASASKGATAPEPENPTAYPYGDMIECVTLFGELHPDWDNPIIWDGLHKEPGIDVLIDRVGGPLVNGYHLGKYPWQDEVVEAMLAWCRDNRMHPKVYAMLNDEEEADVMFRFRYPKHRRNFIRQFANLFAIYKVGATPIIWLNENAAGNWNYCDDRIQFADETDRTLFQVTFPQLRWISTPRSKK